jgi:hypothetical protein
MKSPRFQLSYRLTKHDYREMMSAYWMLTRSRRTRVLILQMIPVAAAAFAAYAWWKSGLTEAAFLAALAMTAPVVAPLINNWAYDRAFAKLRFGEENMMLAAGEEALEISSLSRGETRLPWTGVRHVGATPSTILLWLNPYQAVIVPRLAFASPEEAECFLSLARDRTASNTL